MKKSTKAMLMLVMMLALVLAGCGSKEVTMKEFASSDGTVTISMDEKWQLEDMGVGSEGWWQHLLKMVPRESLLCRCQRNCMALTFRIWTHGRA